MRVTSDTFEYASWPSRKPSKKKLQRESLKRDPIGTLAQVGTIAGKKAVERAGERAGRQVLRNLSAVAGSSALVASTRAAAAAVAPAAAAVATIAGALYGMGKIGELRNLAAGERANRISREFVATQHQVMKQLGARSWDQVPQEIRTKLVNGYKQQIGKVYATAVPLAGTIRPSQALPYGR